MNRVLGTLKSRASLQPQSFLLINSYRAPKGGAKQEVPQGATTDYVGIFKDRPEPVMRKVDDYPEWLISTYMPKPSLYNLIHIWRSGERMHYPKANTNEVLRILHKIKKMRITELNKYKLITQDYEKAKDDLPEDIKYDFYEILAGRRKEMAELGEDAQQDDEGEGGEEEEEEEGPPKRKGVPNYDDEKDTGQKPPEKAGKKR